MMLMLEPMLVQVRALHLCVDVYLIFLRSPAHVSLLTPRALLRLSLHILLVVLLKMTNAKKVWPQG